MACGGTGGHIFPAVAVAEKFGEMFSDAEIVFVGTPRGLERQILGKTGWRLEMIETPSWADKKGLGKLKTLALLVPAVFKAGRLIARESPRLVLGIGGYVSVPIFLAARLRGVPIAAIEPNAVAGVANRYLKSAFKKVFVAFDGLKGVFGEEKTVVTGVPVRKKVFQKKVELDKPAGKTVIAVLGGSQGARRINAAVVEALPFLGDAGKRLHVIHQAGRQADLETLRRAYADRAISCDVRDFIEEIGPVYAAADFAVARAGANTVAELMALRVPAILIPYPFAAGDHQRANAEAMEKIGGARVIPEKELSGEGLAAAIIQWCGDGEKVKTLRENLERRETNRAAEKIAEACRELL